MFGEPQEEEQEEKGSTNGFGSGLRPLRLPKLAEQLKTSIFSVISKKKKKSSKQKKAFDLEEFEKRTQGHFEILVEEGLKTKGDEGATRNLDLDDDAELGDDPFAAPDAPTGVEQGNEAWLGSDRDYTYQELLTRFYTLLHAANPALLSTSSQKRYTIAPPSIHREGNKKTIFANVTDICKRMHRQPEHVIQFLFAEMGTTGSVDGAGRLVIKGRFQQKQVENVLRSFRSGVCYMQDMQVVPDTLLTKEKTYLLHELRELVVRGDQLMRSRVDSRLRLGREQVF
ncbi:translation initiation factor eIF-2 beta subunit [Paramarasmius palmivorus]|uniref:Translation initiation factor eIF-2 beta subunit n=1 Tax=Paramarasmius palmivorus TaxID=297713 RepID=A0AAW0AR44_9AGAR